MNTEQLSKELKAGFEKITEVKLNLQQAKEVTELVFDTIGDKVADGEKVKIVGFGEFESKERSARKGRNPQDGSEIMIAATTVPKFKALKGLKDKVKG